LAAQVISGDMIRLAWTDNSDDESGFRVQRKPYQGLSDWQTVVDLPFNTETYDDTNSLYGNVVYTYRVGAY